MEAPTRGDRVADPLATSEHTISLQDAGRALGLSRTATYEAVREGRFPVPVLRVGRTYRIPVAPLRRLLDGQEPKHAARQVTA